MHAEHIDIGVLFGPGSALKMGKLDTKSRHTFSLEISEEQATFKPAFPPGYWAGAIV
jgi:hypothetical protein